MTDTLARLTPVLAGRYRVERELGAGGMATVFLAEDVRHRRRVAIKVLHPELSAVLGPERFLKEIELTANLQHPHILALFDSGAADGLLYYVMPFMEGETLRARLERERQLPVADALRVAGEVADALAYAHAHGVIHRDIKPENILLQGGHAVVADFGIALAVEQAGGQRMTQTGLSLGTPHYMAPEQAMGEKSVDARADVYALGAVTYEMLSGEPPFTGPTAQAIVAKVISAVPAALTGLRSTVPPGVAAAVHTALEKLPADRFASAAEFADALRRPLATGPVTATQPSVPIPPASRRAMAVRAVPWLVAGSALVAAVAMRSAAPSGAAPVTRAVLPLELRLTAEAPLNEVDAPFDLSHDGSVLVFVGPDPEQPAKNALWRRPLDRLEATPIPGSRGAFAPRLSYDGRFVSFRGPASGASRQGTFLLPIEGGVPTSLPLESRVYAWRPDGSLLVYGERGFVLRRPDAPLDPANALRLSPNLSGVQGRRLIGSRRMAVSPNGEIAAVVVGIGNEDSLALMRTDQRTPTFILEGTSPAFLDDGHLLWLTSDGTLLVASFDPRRLVLTGQPRALAQGIGRAGNRDGLYALAGDGTLVFVPGAAADVGRPVWVDRRGTEQGMPGVASASYGAVAISPDDRFVAYELGSMAAGGDIWVLDVRQGTGTRLTTDGRSGRPAWSPDGRFVAYSTDAITGSVGSVVKRPPNGAAMADTLFRLPPGPVELAWLPDGGSILYRGSLGSARGRDIFLRRLSGDTARVSVVAEPSQDRGPRVSPDGRWLLYASDRSGRDEIYVEAFPSGGRRTIVSASGGIQPTWSRDGREIFYRALDGVMMAARFQAGDQPEITGRDSLFDASPYLTNPYLTTYDVARDGRFLMTRLEGNVTRTDAVLVRGWRGEVERLLRGESR